MLKVAYDPIKNHDVPIFSKNALMSTSHANYDNRWKLLNDETYIFLTLDPVKHSKIPLSIKITESQREEIDKHFSLYIDFSKSSDMR